MQYHICTGQRGIYLVMKFSVGDCVMVIGGTYEGETAKVYSVASKSVRLILSGNSDPTGNIPFKNIISFSTGDKVKVISGTHEGKSGEIYSIAEKTCRLILNGNQNPTGNIPFESVSVTPGEEKQDKNNNSIQLKPQSKSV